MPSLFSNTFQATKKHAFACVPVFYIAILIQLPESDKMLRHDHTLLFCDSFDISPFQPIFTKWHLQIYLSVSSLAYPTASGHARATLIIIVLSVIENAVI